jgi:hypothetical protein
MQIPTKSRNISRSVPYKDEESVDVDINDYFSERVAG